MTADVPEKVDVVQVRQPFGIVGQNGVGTFEVDEFRKECMLQGLDEIGLTLQSRRDVSAYEQRRRNEAPWLFNEESPSA